MKAHKSTNSKTYIYIHLGSCSRHWAKFQIVSDYYKHLFSNNGKNKSVLIRHNRPMINQKATKINFVLKVDVPDIFDSIKVPKRSELKSSIPAEILYSSEGPLKCPGTNCSLPG